MSFGVAMSRRLTCEVPSSHHTFSSFTFRSSFHIHTLANLVVQRTEHVSNRQKVLGTHFELTNMLLGRNPRFEKFTNLGLLEQMSTILLSNSQDQSVDSIFF